MLRKLRIAFSSACGIICLLLIVLWVRSCLTSDLLELYYGYGYGGHIGSFDRGIEFCVSTGQTDFPNAKPGIRYKAVPKKVQPAPKQGIAKYGFHAFTGAPGVYFLQMPLLFLALIAVVLSAAPWFQLRFSLRALLIGMTLVALLLGIIAVSR